MMIAPPPADADFGFFSNYVNLATHTELIAGLRENLEDLKQLFGSMSEEQLLHRYAAGKWSLKEMLAHLIDAERTFCYRALRVSRGDQQQIPPMSPDEFVKASLADGRSRESLLEELEANRRASITFYSHMPAALLDVSGPGRDAPITTRGLGYAQLGHAIYHMGIVKDRYLAGAAVQA